MPLLRPTLLIVALPITIVGVVMAAIMDVDTKMVLYVDSWHHASHGDQQFPSTDYHPQCQTCNGTNHTVLNYYRRYNNTSVPSANLASCSTPYVPISEWFPNTAAIHHATPRSGCSISSR
ncbi:hypothetical protein U1Q18_017679 [Sarracenia purpurea var. burkii]